MIEDRLILWHPATVHYSLDDGMEITAEGGTARVCLLAAQRPFSDEFLDFRLELHDVGLAAATGVRTIEGDGLAVWVHALAQSYAGWDGERIWESLERDARISARHDGRGHVTLRFVVRGGVRGCEPDAWEASVSVYLDAGEDMRRLADAIEAFAT